MDVLEKIEADARARARASSPASRTSARSRTGASSSSGRKSETVAVLRSLGDLGLRSAPEGGRGGERAQDRARGSVPRETGGARRGEDPERFRRSDGSTSPFRRVRSPPGGSIRSPRPSATSSTPSSRRATRSSRGPRSSSTTTTSRRSGFPRTTRPGS